MSACTRTAKASSSWTSRRPWRPRPARPNATPAERAALGYNALARLAAGRVDAFVACAGWLNAQGLSAPTSWPPIRLPAWPCWRTSATTCSPADRDRADEAPLYDAAIDGLLALHESPAPQRAADGSTWPLLTYDDLALKTAHDVFTEWLPKLRPEPHLRRQGPGRMGSDLGADPRPRRGRRNGLLPPRLSRREPDLAAGPRGRGPGRPARLPGRGPGPSGLGPVDAAARRPPRRLARPRGRLPGPLSGVRPDLDRRPPSWPTTTPWARSTSPASWASSPGW
jgi:hypothetical protein